MKKVVVGVCILLSIALCGAYFVPLFRFLPRRLETGQENRLLRASDLETPVFYGKLERVLKYYNVRYRMSGAGIIYVPIKLALDSELCWNYTKKAVDNDWQGGH